MASEAATRASAAAPGQAGAVSRLPWPAAGATLIAFAALYVSDHSFPGLPLLALALAATYAFDARLENRSWAPWAVRAVLFTVITIRRPAMGLPGFWLFDPQYVYSFGQLCAAEIVVQCWRRRLVGGPGGLGVMLLSGLVFASAAGTFETGYICWFAPAYFFCIALALGDAVALKGRALAALLVALAIGAAVSWSFWTYRAELTYLFMEALRTKRPGGLVGLSTAPRLERTQGLQGSPDRVLRVRGAPGEPHLRAMAFDNYDRGRWGPDLMKRAPEMAPPPALRQTASGRRVRITSLAGNDQMLFVPLHCAGLVPPGEVQLQWDPQFGGPIRTPQALPCPYSYDAVLSGDADHQGPLCTPLTATQRARCLALPGNLDPKVRDLALSIASPSSSPRDRVRAVEDYLRANHCYSLTMDPGPGDPVTSFLLGRKAAHCEYFASAAVILLRCLDVPTRYVTGYYAHEAAGSGIMVVRGRDAHAWAEAWVEGRGWVTVEATPAGGLPSAFAPVPFYTRAWEWVADIFAEISDRLSAMGWLAILGWSGGVVAACFIAVRLWRKLRAWRRAAPRVAAHAYSSPREEFAAIAARFENLLRRTGLPCPAQRTWQEHLAMPRASGSPAATDAAAPRVLEEAAEFVMQYNAARFGTPDDSDAVARARAALESLER
ncbi:MAG: transglutaminaseTgpA domain-containing protein [Planctomycetota bacterium]|nr:transglutaminaseTgpA domain-containing protein [Planctomycetota bacterium]